MTQYDVEFSVVAKRRIEVVVPDNPTPLNFVEVTVGGTDGTEEP